MYERVNQELQSAVALKEEAINESRATIAALRRQVNHLERMRQTGLWVAEQESAFRELKTVLASSSRQGGATMNGLIDLCASRELHGQQRAVGVSITSVLGSLGAAGAAVTVTYYFLGFLRDQSEKQSRLFQDFKDYHSESQKKFQDQLDRLSDRQEQSQRGFKIR